MKTFSDTSRKPVLPLFMRLLWAAAFVLTAFGVQAGAVLTTLHSFQPFPNGANPDTALVQGSDGNFYGTTPIGGTNSVAGTVFKISANGALTTLYSFTGGNDGANPRSLVQGSDGSFYGTTAAGGIYPGAYFETGAGTVFKISTNGALTTLYSFTGGDDGSGPNGLVQGSDGNFYGTTGDGSYNLGTVFKISINGALTTLYSFTGANDDGGYPPQGLVQGTDGNFYGTTVGGGTDGDGTVFKISTIGALTTLYSFTGGNDGAYPIGLAQASDGSFYGTTVGGGTPLSLGTVFKISTTGRLTTLYSFANYEIQPSELVQGSDGNFYGTTFEGGTNGAGSVFQLSSGGTWTTLYTFTGGNDGANPSAGLVQGSDGNFYGTTWAGGGTSLLTDNGTVFKISSNGALTTLYSFPDGNDGAYPKAGLLQGSDGNFYGTAFGGGTNGAGTVFKISTSGAWTSLHTFTGANDGGNPSASLLQGSDGNFYGTTTGGGTNGAGTVFQISGTGALISLYSFTGANDGGNPQGGLVQGSDGSFYGTTAGGGTYTNGTVFKISMSGALTTLYSFTGGNDGANPSASLLQGSDGNFYGTTSQGGTNGNGTVFQISANGALTSLYSFNFNDGDYPQAGLVQGSDGDFYGTTSSGGTNGYEVSTGYLNGDGFYYGGTVFKISTNGALTSLYSFGTDADTTPYAGLVQGSDGYLYGTTYYGGGGIYDGTVFKINTNCVLTTLYSFGTILRNGYAAGENAYAALDGASPYAGLVQGSDGSFYGTTSAGGPGGAGTVFRLTIVPESQAVTLTNGTLSLTWSTEAGGMYQLQYNSDLSSSNWSNLGSAVTATGATLSTTDSLTNGPQRFYRLALLP
jgi:uncharacterized repeat protein (TIGR03803 family)